MKSSKQLIDGAGIINNKQIAGMKNTSIETLKRMLTC